LVIEEEIVDGFIFIDVNALSGIKTKEHLLILLKTSGYNFQKIGTSDREGVKIIKVTYTKI